jgi:DNA repair ATPase RecN
MHPEPVLFICGFFATILTAIVTLGPVGRAFAERLRTKGTAGSLGAVQDQLDEVIARLDDVQRQLGDVAERQDFSERMLAKARDRGLIEGSK